jgi:hypothetical protein
MKKMCLKCKELKDLKEFYIHNQMADKHLSFCKKCVQKRIHNRYISNIELMRKKEKERYDRRKLNPKFVIKKREYTKQYRKRKDRKISNSVYRKLYASRPNHCENCLIKQSKLSWTLHAHHFDYKKPLEVKWLCSACHKQEHLKIKD